VSFTQSDGAKDTRKKSKERERRRSIIQAVSDFFHKKKESSRSPSPPKISLGSSHSTKDKLTRFRLNRHKDKGKVSKIMSSILSKTYSTGILSYLTTRIAAALRMFFVLAVSTANTAILNML
jgi:hypothetical protein